MGNYNGTRTDAASRYGAGSGAVQPLPSYFYAFDTLDTRRDVTVTTYAIGATNLKTPRRPGELTDGKYRRDWRNPLLPGSVLNCGFNWVLIRFSDVLLMFAETENEINGTPTPAAIVAFEEVRKRAYLGNAAKIGTTPTTKQGFFDALVNERWLEFGGEAIRKYDLIRWNLLTSKLATARQAIQDIRDGVGVYANFPNQVYWRQNGEEIEYFAPTGSKQPFNTPIQTPNPTTGWTKTDWRAHLATASAIDAKPLWQGFAFFFTPNKSELFPFDQATMDAYQGKLTQNPGY